MDLAGAGADPLLWAIARCADIPADLVGVLAMPATVLWQCEVMLDVAARVAEVAELDRIGEAAARKVGHGRF